MSADLHDSVIRLYLLGLLSQEEVDTLEAAYFESADVLDRVRGVENDLLDDYAAGRLDSEEVRALEARYLASPLLRQRVRAARALRPALTSVARPTPRLRLSRWLAPLAIAAGLVLALLGFALWPSRSVPRTAQQPLQSPTSVPSPPASTVATPIPPSPVQPEARPLARVVLALGRSLGTPIWSIPYTDILNAGTAPVQRQNVRATVGTRPGRDR